jgi:hypothetical protein
MPNQLPPIPSPEPQTLPALPTEYAELFISDLRIKAVPGKAWSLSAVFLPYNYAASTLMPGGRPQELRLSDLVAKAGQYPATVGQALGAVLAVAPLLLREQQLEQVLAAADGEAAPEMLAELETVRAQLSGV